MRNTLMCSWRTVTTSGRESGHPGGAMRGQDRAGETSLRSVMLHPYTGKMNDFQWFEYRDKITLLGLRTKQIVEDQWKLFYLSQIEC